MPVIVEESYKITVWCREIIDGLRQEARKKRVNLTFSSDVADIDPTDGERAVIIIGSETEWLSRAAFCARKASKHPIILSNQSENALEGNFSCVTVDIKGSMRAICDLFSEKGCKNLALYAVNPASASDTCLKDGFLSSGGLEQNIFANDGSLKLCFDNFYAKHKKSGYDGIICTNDFAAISLIRHLRDEGEQIDGLNLISYSNTLVSRCFSPSISSVMTNYESFGQLAFMIIDCLSKSEFVSSMRISRRWDIIHRETTRALSPIPRELPESPTLSQSPKSQFYGDPEIIDMVRIENLLSLCDNTDLDMLEMILEGKKTAEMVGACYLTETAVKYRIKKMKDICGVSSREELRCFLTRYVNSIAPLKR